MEIFPDEKPNNNLAQISQSLKQVPIHISPPLLVGKSLIDINKVKHSVVYHLILEVYRPRGINHWLNVLELKCLQHRNGVVPSNKLLFTLSLQNLLHIIMLIYVFGVTIYLRALSASLGLKPGKGRMRSLKHTAVRLREIARALWIFWCLYCAPP